MKWAKEGDENSKVFHSTIRHSERKNGIRGLQTPGGWVEELAKLKKTHILLFQRKVRLFV